MGDSDELSIHAVPDPDEPHDGDEYGAARLRGPGEPREPADLLSDVLGEEWPSWVSADWAQAVQDGATALPPPAPPDCPDCGLTADRYPTYTQAWVLLEPLRPNLTVPSHIVPPAQRWIIDGNGLAWNTHDGEPTQGAHCRIAHRLVSP
ncbi:DUF6083 domain-containing protein, partial [Streptomyces sp. NPDC127044]